MKVDDLLEEIWSGLIYNGIDYSDRLEISNLGILRNIITGTIYKTHINKGGYYEVCISLGSKNNKKTFRIHKCVACTFIPNPKNKPTVNHIDCNKENNIITNLEWATLEEQMQHAYKHNLVTTRYGENNPNSKLTNEDVCFIRNNYKAYDKIFGSRGLSRIFNIDHSCIIDILHNKTYIK